MLDSKKIIEEKIDDIDQMLSELDFGGSDNADSQKSQVEIDINGLDVLDVLHNILN